MNDENILMQLNSIFKDVLDNDDIDIRPETTASDIIEWDSLAHIQLVFNIEKHFKIRFLSSEIQEWVNVGEMLSSIKRLLSIA